MSLALNRKWLIYWMYFVAFGHFIGGVLVSWFSNAEFFNGYHNEIVARFGTVNAQLHGLHIWWLNLFGATLQNIAIYMGVLVHVGNKTRSALVWIWMAIGLIIWFPQDIIISMRINLWIHVWVDVVAMLILLVPIMLLWAIDKKCAQS